MERIVEKLWVLRHEPVGPLLPFLDLFAINLNEQGFKRRVLRPQIRVLAKFSQWLQDQRVAVDGVTDEHARRFLEEVTSKRFVQLGGRATLRRFMDFMDANGVNRPSPEHREPSEIQHLVEAYALYLRQERMLADRTLSQYCPIIERFLSERFDQRPLVLADLQASDVIGFVKQQAARFSPARSKVVTTALRSFLRYLRYRGDSQLDLAAAVPTVANWSMPGIPRAIAPEHAHAVFAHCPRDTDIGRRDYAILMLLGRLGLRSIEIVALTLESIDWNAGAILVAGKGRRVTSLPLPVEVGVAISDYLIHGRHACSSRALFLRTLAPIRGLGASQSIATIVGTAIRRAGIDTPHKGSHQFRHALAADLLRNGASLTEIGSVLRHRHVKTTGIYAKVDFVALRRLCQPWPGGAA